MTDVIYCADCPASSETTAIRVETELCRECELARKNEEEWA